MAAVVSQVSSALKKTIQTKEKTHGHGTETVKTVSSEEHLCAMSEIPDFVVRGNRCNCSNKFNMATSMICRGGGLYGDEEGLGFIVYGSFEDTLQV